MLKPKQPEREPRDREDEMSAEKNVVEKLVQGSRNIDEMRKRIDMVVGMILCVMKEKITSREVKEDNNDYPTEIFKEYGKNLCWRLVVVFTTTQKIDCFIASCSFINSGESIFSSHISNSPKHGNVQEVYESLLTFVDAVFKRFPKVEEACQPFFEAAEVNLV